MLLIAEDAERKYITHLIQLASEKDVPVVYYPLKRYRACGIIKTLPADA
jgi:ribosomal protein L7Ae-like RNA K-turn-binding protein